MFPCDPVLLVLFVALIVLIALIMRELAIRNGLLDGSKVFDGSAPLVAGGNCFACGGNEESTDGSILDALEK